MGSQGARPRLDQLLVFLFHPSSSQFGQLLRVLLPLQHGLQNRPSRLAGAIAGYGGQLDIGVFERLLDATLQPCAIIGGLLPKKQTNEQPACPPCELAQEAFEDMPWLRRRLASGFEQSGRSFPERGPGRSSDEVVVAEIRLQMTTA